MTALPLIAEPSALAQVLDQDDLLVLDLRAEENYLDGHIPNALRFELSDVVRSESPVGGLLADEAAVSAALSTVGYNGSQHIVAVDDNGGPQACRLIWTLEAYGIDRCSLLNGGMAAWKGEIEALDSTPEQAEPSGYQAHLKGDNAMTKDEILERLDDTQLQIIDARSKGEYEGSDVRSDRGGHIPGAIHLEWTDLKDSCNLKFKPAQELQAIVEQAGIQRSKDCVAYCQTHMRSSVVCIALKSLGYELVKGYPGAWSDWGNDPSTPIA